MTNLETDALYSIVLHPNDVFFEECIKLNIFFAAFSEEICKNL